jgi:hypothetical protein
MKKLMTIFGAIIFASFFLICCRNGPNPEEKAKIIKEYNDSVALAEKAKQDSINAILPAIKVRIFERTNVLYDSEGWPVEMGRVIIVKDFQEKKVYQLKGYDYIEKIEIEGQSENITLQFLNAKNNKIIHEEKEILINGIKKYTWSDPKGGKYKNYQEWLKITKWDELIIKVFHKDHLVFEGKIFPAK